MASIAKFDTWQTTSGVNMGTVVQVQHHFWHKVSSHSAQNWTEVPGSYFEIVTKVTNSRIHLYYSGHAYKSGSTDGFGIQIARILPNHIDLWNPFSTWAAGGHDAFPNGCAASSIQYTDTPLVPAGTKLAYVLKVWKYAGNGSITFNWESDIARWGGALNTASAQNPSNAGYTVANGIVATEIAPK